MLERTIQVCKLYLENFGHNRSQTVHEYFSLKCHYMLHVLLSFFKVMCKLGEMLNSIYPENYKEWHSCATWNMPTVYILLCHRSILPIFFRIRSAGETGWTHVNWSHNSTMNPWLNHTKTKHTNAVWHLMECTHDDVIKWKHFPRHWPFVQGIHRSPALTKASDAELWCFLLFAPE